MTDDDVIASLPEILAKGEPVAMHGAVWSDIAAPELAIKQSPKDARLYRLLAAQLPAESTGPAKWSREITLRSDAGSATFSEQ